MFWETKERRPDRNADIKILVDLMHDNVKYLCFNLVLSKYLELRNNGTLVGVCKNWTTAFNNYKFEVNSGLAQAFGASKVINFDGVEADVFLPEDATTLSEIKKYASGSHEFSLRDYIFNNKSHSLEAYHLLRIAYDHYLRNNLFAEAPSVSESFIDTLKCCARFRRLAKSIVVREGIEIAVLGHIEYSPYYFIAEQVIKEGGTVFFHWPLVFGSVRILRDMKSLNMAKDIYFSQWYKDKYLTSLNRFDHTFSEYVSSLAKKVSFSRNYSEFEEYHVPMSRIEFFQSCGISRVRPHTIVLMSHALSDAVHANGPMLFYDFGSWLRETVEYFANDVDVNILIKVHPKDSTYDSSGFIAKLCEEFEGIENFGLVSRYINNREVAKHCDVASTVNGTPGFELQAQGMPTVIAGESRYSGLGICNNPNSKQEYFQELKKVAIDRESDKEKMRLAAQFAFFENVVSSVKSPLVPNVTSSSLNDLGWAQYSSVLHGFYIEEDPLWQAIGNYYNFKAPVLTNPAFLLSG